MLFLNDKGRYQTDHIAARGENDEAVFQRLLQDLANGTSRHYQTLHEAFAPAGA